MTGLLHQLLVDSARHSPQAPALRYLGQDTDYASLSAQVSALANGYLRLQAGRCERIAIYLEKRPEAVVAMFAASACGATFVPVNPLLKAEQVSYILLDCHVKILVTSATRLQALKDILPLCPELHTVIVLDASGLLPSCGAIAVMTWAQAMALSPVITAHRCIDTDMAAILYTSGSTGQPKGVVLSHRNLLAGAASVAGYLENTASDRILAVLPFSFDYGLSQLTTALRVGACIVLMNYLMPQDIVRAVAEEKITGLAAVPPLWIMLAQQKWPSATSLRYLTNSGGVMPGSTLDALRVHFPAAKIFLMYGLTEAFRSSYLDPAELDRRPGSIGKAIPGAELLLINKDGRQCAPGEEGELVHRGALVALGYWNDRQKTSERFRPLAVLPHTLGLPLTEIAVWSGDTVRQDEEGFLYFVGRDDDMIKVSGYRISPTEVEQVADHFSEVTELVAVGVAHPVTGQAIVLVVRQNSAESFTSEAIRRYCQARLPAYMMPSHIELVPEDLPRNANGKIDRQLVKARFSSFFITTETGRGLG